MSGGSGIIKTKWWWRSDEKAWNRKRLQITTKQSTIIIIFTNDYGDVTQTIRRATRRETRRYQLQLWQHNSLLSLPQTHRTTQFTWLESPADERFVLALNNAHESPAMVPAPRTHSSTAVRPAINHHDSSGPCSLQHPASWLAGCSTRGMLTQTQRQTSLAASKQ